MPFGDTIFGAAGFGASSAEASAPVPDPISRVIAVTITPGNVTISGDTPVQFFAEVLGDNGPSQEVFWDTTLGDVDEAGLLMPPAATSQLQQGTITATSLEDTKISASTTFNITPLASAFVPSAARIVRILPGRLAFAVGSHWTLSTAGPVGPKDPNSTIDIPFDWSAWLADIGNAQLARVEFLLGGGLQNEGMVPDANAGTVLVSGGVPGTSATVTCRITTATTPPRTDDRTVVLQIKDQ